MVSSPNGPSGHGGAAPGRPAVNLATPATPAAKMDGALSSLNLFSEVSLISSGHGYPDSGGRSWRPSSRPTRVERTVDRPTMRSRPSDGCSARGPGLSR
jgi:hypothetical protein